MAQLATYHLSIIGTNMVFSNRPEGANGGLCGLAPHHKKNWSSAYMM